MFNLTELAKLALRHIERCFTIVCESQNLLELDFTLIARILHSSQLHIDSELEILEVADNWLKFNPEKRNKFAKMFLTYVRLQLLSSPALESILGEEKDSTFKKFDKCASILREFLKGKKSPLQNKST